MNKVCFKLFGIPLVLAAMMLTLSPDSMAATIVKQDLIDDTVWKTGESPYVVTADVVLHRGVSLKIEPGVRVEVDGGKSIRIEGKLTAVGAKDEPIVFTARSREPWKQLYFTDFSDDAVYSEDGAFVDGCILKHCIIEKSGGIYVRFGAPFITQCHVRDNVSSGIRVEFGAPRIVGNRIYHNSTEQDPASGNGGGIIAYTDKYVLIADNIIHNNVSDGGRDGGGGVHAYVADNGRIVIENNVLFGNTSSRFGGGIYTYRADVVGNTVVGNSAAQRGGGLFVVESKVHRNLVQSNAAEQGAGVFAENSQLLSNSVIRNSARHAEGGALYYFGSGQVLRNTLVGNRAVGVDGDEGCGGVYLSGNPALHGNNIFNNTGYALYIANVADAPEVSAHHNFWGADSEKAILRLTHDWLDDDAAGLAVCFPFLEHREDGAPDPPPTSLLASATAGGIRLWWDEPAGLFDGHRIYLGSESGYPYEEVRQVGAENECLVEDLKPGTTYYVAVSGHRLVNGEEVETGLSEEVRVLFTGSERTLGAPENLSPADGASRVPLQTVLEAARPKELSRVDAARWQVSSSPDFFARAMETIVPADGSPKLSLETHKLLSGQKYFWRMAYEKAGSWSQWSKPTSFVTVAENPSTLSGPIPTEVKLEKRFSPYTVTANTLVMPEGALTIEPGVQLKLARGAHMMVRGKLVARGAPSDPIVFTRESSENWGRLIFADASKNAELDENENYVDGTVLEYCKVQYGEGVLIESASPLIKNCDISYHRGSGVAVRHGGPVISHNDIHHNMASTNGGGIYAYTNDIIHLTSNKVHDNRANGDGGGVFAYGYMNTSAIRVQDNDVISNEAAGNGGGIYISRSSAVGNRVESNRAEGDGGGIYATFGLIDANEIRRNRAAEGGGIFAERNSSITRNYITSNEARSGFGGGVYINFWGASIENEVFTQNTVTTNLTPSDAGNGGVFVVGYILFERNNIYDNVGSQLYNGNKSDSAPLVISQCYWGTADREAVAHRIIDGDDDPELGQVTYQPFSPEPITFD